MECTNVHVHVGTLSRSSGLCLCLNNWLLHICLVHCKFYLFNLWTIFCLVACLFIYIMTCLLTDVSVRYLHVLVNFSIFIHRSKTWWKSRLWISLSLSQPNLLSNNQSAFTKTAVEGYIFCSVAPCACIMQWRKLVIHFQRSYSVCVGIDGKLGWVTWLLTEACLLQGDFSFTNHNLYKRTYSFKQVYGHWRR